MSGMATQAAEQRGGKEGLWACRRAARHACLRTLPCGSTSKIVGTSAQRGLTHLQRLQSFAPGLHHEWPSNGRQYQHCVYLAFLPTPPTATPLKEPPTATPPTGPRTANPPTEPPTTDFITEAPTTIPPTNLPTANALAERSPDQG